MPETRLISWTASTLHPICLGVWKAGFSLTFDLYIGSNRALTIAAAAGCCYCSNELISCSDEQTETLNSPKLTCRRNLNLLVINPFSTLIVVLQACGQSCVLEIMKGVKPLYLLYKLEYCSEQRESYQRPGSLRVLCSVLVVHSPGQFWTECSGIC